MIKKTVCYDSSPALHIAEARVIELSSGTSLAQFLMVRPHLKRLLLFIDVLASCEALEKSQQLTTLPPLTVQSLQRISKLLYY